MAFVWVGAFLCVMFVIGFWGMKKTKTVGDFFLGGRSIGPWVSAFAYGTTYFSAVLFIGFAGKLGWAFGLNALYIALGNIVFGSLGAWIVLGKRTRRMSQNLNAMTMPEFLYERYDGTYIKMVSALIIFIFLVPYSASVFKGLSHLFEVYFNIPYDTILLIIIFVTGLYLIMGGYHAITLTDFIQGLVMIVGVISLVIVLSDQQGGVVQAITRIREIYPVHMPQAKQPPQLLLWSLVFMTSFGVWGLPQMVQKFYAIKDESMIKVGAIVTTIFALIISVSAYYIGALTHLYFDAVPMANGVPQFDSLISTLLVNHAPAVLMVLMLLLILSASMSTLSSLILVSASAIAIDLYQGHINPQASKGHSLFMMRFLSAVFIAFSYFIAKHQFVFIVTLMSLSWGAVAGAFMAPYLFSLYWKRTTLAGVKAGMATGLTLAVSLFFYWGPKNSPIAASVAILVPFIVVPVVSVMTKPPQEALVAKAFRDIA